jgi:hypothetical protein
MADIFREVDEALREDRVKTVWTRYGRLIMAAAILIVVGTAAWVGWKEWSATRDAQGAAAIEAARADGSVAALSAGVDAAGNADQAALARLYLAAAQIQAGDVAAGVATYRAVADDSGIDPVMRDLARLQAVMHQVDTGDAAQLSTEIAPLAADGSPWRFSAREIQGVLALKQGDVAGARTIFQALSDDAETPAGIRGRAAEVLGSLGEQE